MAPSRDGHCQMHARVAPAQASRNVVISTSALMARIPLRSIRSRSQSERSCSGIDTTDRHRPQYRGHASAHRGQLRVCMIAGARAQSGGGHTGAGKCGDLAGDTCEAQAIGPVRCELDRKRDIIERQIITNVVADGCVRGQLKQPPWSCDSPVRAPNKAFRTIRHPAILQP